MKYKLIVVCCDEFATGEYDNVVNGMKAAERRAEELVNEYKDDCGGDVRVECYEYSEFIDAPLTDGYVFWTIDYFGDFAKMWMYLSDHGTRLDSRMYNKQDRI